MLVDKTKTKKEHTRGSKRIHVLSPVVVVAWVAISGNGCGCTCSPYSINKKLVVKTKTKKKRTYPGPRDASLGPFLCSWGPGSGGKSKRQKKGPRRVSGPVLAVVDGVGS